VNGGEVRPRLGRPDGRLGPAEQTAAAAGAPVPDPGGPSSVLLLVKKPPGAAPRSTARDTGPARPAIPAQHGPRYRPSTARDTGPARPAIPAQHGWAARPGDLEEGGRGSHCQAGSPGRPRVSRRHQPAARAGPPSGPRSRRAPHSGAMAQRPRTGPESGAERLDGARGRLGTRTHRTRGRARARARLPGTAHPRACALALADSPGSPLPSRQAWRRSGAARLHPGPCLWQPIRARRHRIRLGRARAIRRFRPTGTAGPTCSAELRRAPWPSGGHTGGQPPPPPLLLPLTPLLAGGSVELWGLPVPVVKAGGPPPWLQPEDRDSDSYCCHVTVVLSRGAAHRNRRLAAT
jgi:hypothetical protein